MNRVAIGAVILFSIVSSNVALATTADDFLYRNSEPDGSGLPYRVFVPAVCAAPVECPVILFLHGAGERGSNNTSQLNNRANRAMELVDGANLAADPMLMIAPQCPTGVDWGSTANQIFIADILEDVAEEFGYDETRAYVTGLSMGGNGTWMTLKNFATFFAAGAPICGWGSTAASSASFMVPQWISHAANDPTVGVAGSRDMVTRLHNEGGDPIYTEFDSGGHAIWDDVYQLPEIFDWLRAHQRRLPGSVSPFVRITDPTTEAVWATAGSEITLSGTAGDAGAATAGINWFADWGASGTAAGTTSWTTGPVSLPSGSGRIRVEAEGTSFVASLGGVSIYSDTLTATSTSGSNQAPRVVIGGLALGQIGVGLNLHAAVTDDGLPNGTLGATLWEILDGPGGALLSPDGSLATFHAAAPGRYLLRAAVDDGGLQGSGTLEIVIVGGLDPPVVAAVNSNGPAVTSSMGIDFTADQHFTGGSTSAATIGILGTRDDILFGTYRWGDFSYSIPVPAGRYFLVLIEAESSASAPGDRRFDIEVEGISWITDLDVLERTHRHGPLTIGRQIEVVDGALDVAFNAGSAGNAMVAGLAVIDLDAVEGVIFADGFETGDIDRWD
jgi:predicted esterase